MHDHPVRPRIPTAGLGRALAPVVMLCLSVPAGAQVVRQVTDGKGSGIVLGPPSTPRAFTSIPVQARIRSGPIRATSTRSSASMR
jgi:hypothetical protein